MLSKTPADRLASARQFSEDLIGIATTTAVEATLGAVREKPLKKVIGYAAIAILAVIGAYTVITQTVGSSGSMVAAEPPKLAVLPFNNLGSPEDEYFADGITEEITSRIAEISGLRVISRQSAIQYKGSDKTLRQIGRELNVDYVLEGTIRTDRPAQGSGQVRVTPQLIRVSDDAHLWTDRYTAALVPGEIFGVQEHIANQVAGALDVTLLEPERTRLAERPTHSLEAYQYYLRGIGYWEQRVPEQIARQAVEMYQRAVSVDPGFATAYAALSRAWAWLGWYSGDPEGFPRAQEAVDRAQELAPDLTAAHLARGTLLYWSARDYERALEELAIVLNREPNNAEVMLQIGSIQKRQGKWEEALTSLGKAHELDPRSGFVAVNAGGVYHALHRYEEAERSYDHGILLAADVPVLYAAKVALYLAWDGNVARAKEVIEGAQRRFDSVLWVFNMFELLGYSQLGVFGDDYGGSVELPDGATASDRVIYYFTKAEFNARNDQAALARAYYDSSRTVLQARIRLLDDADERGFASAQLPHLHSALGYAYAGMRQKDDAIREGRRGVELLPVSRDAYQGPYHIEALARIYVVVGEHEAALTELEYLLANPSWFSASVLRVDPLWDSLRDNLRFEALLEKYETSEK
jgi:serine/threonine-protein kinase